MNNKAKNEFNFPQSNKSGTRINSSVFIIATMNICAIAFKRGFKPLKIQTAIPILADSN